MAEEGRRKAEVAVRISGGWLAEGRLVDSWG